MDSWDGIPAKRTMAPAAGFLTVVIVDVISSGEGVKETLMPLSESCCFSGSMVRG